MQGLPELLREVTVLSVYRHPSIVPLLSFCLSRHDGQQQACLVYPLMAGGGLDQALAARAVRPLDAAARLRIAADVAAGLAFLLRYKYLKQLSILAPTHANYQPGQTSSIA